MASFGPFYHNSVYPRNQFHDCAIAKYSDLKYTCMDLGNYNGLVLGSH